ncbi:hypothetical protein [Promicromonospora panici]|uniref:hypothetical protein n=1 Tax=Promicromonospora panici TaxID=2219658 RepID=UPI00101BEFE8|nr:hypothetical protein [Promicromonospora panici]
MAAQKRDQRGTIAGRRGEFERGPFVTREAALLNADTALARSRLKPAPKVAGAIEHIIVAILLAAELLASR